MLYCSGEAGQPDRCAFARSVVISSDSVSLDCSSFTGRYLNVPGENAFFSSATVGFSTSVQHLQHNFQSAVDLTYLHP